MKILVLDDDPLRHRSFARRFKGDEIVHVYSPLEAAEHMGKTKFDLVQLDHDLGFWTDRENVPPSFFGGYADDARMKVELKGFHVAVWMRQMPEATRPTRVVVHSANAVGGPMMAELLSQGGFDAVWDEFKNDKPTENLFYFFMTLHELAGPCIACEPGYPKTCDFCGGLVHAQVEKNWYDKKAILQTMCEDCAEAKQLPVETKK
jgi:CheY-like chemotaxis protein